MTPRKSAFKNMIFFLYPVKYGMTFEGYSSDGDLLTKKIGGNINACCLFKVWGWMMENECGIFRVTVPLKKKL
jgi:hypothetical protein